MATVEIERAAVRARNRETIQLLIGFVLTFWAGVSALLTHNGIAIVCLASGAIFFVAGVIQVYGHPRRVATMLDMFF